MNKKKLVIVFFLLIFAFLAIRIVGLNSPLYDDEVDHLLSRYNPQPFGLNPHTTKPPLMSWMNLSFSSTFGEEIWKVGMIDGHRSLDIGRAFLIWM